MKHKAIQTAGLIILLFLGLVPPVISASAKQEIPDAELRVTVQQKEAGKLSPVLHMQEILCSNGACSLTSITLHGCRRSLLANGVASFIAIERSSTREGNLKVTREGDTLVVIETGFDIGGNYVTTQRFNYEKPRDGGVITKLIGYSGGFVKNSIIARQVITIEYVPLKGGYKKVKLDCPLALPGVDVSK